MKYRMEKTRRGEGYLKNVVGVGQYGECGAVGDTKLPVNPVQVNLDGAFREPKPPRYFPVGQTFGDHADDLALTRSERVGLTRSYLGRFFQGLLHGVSFSTNSAGHSMFRDRKCKNAV